MKTSTTPLNQSTWVLGLAVCLALFSTQGRGAIVHANHATLALSDSSAEAGTVETKPTAEQDVTIETPPPQEISRKDVPWLGVSTSEVSDALSSQLDLPPGVGLLVTYLAPDSPAAKAGLKRNDVIVRFEDQQLVHPAQLRKLVRVHKEDDVVKLEFYRAGKRQTASVSLGKARPTTDWSEEGQAFKGSVSELQKQFRDLHIDEVVKEQMSALRESLGNIKINQKEVQEDIRRGMEQARKAIEEAMRNVTNGDPMRKVMENLAHSGVVLDDKADVVVRSSGHNTKSMVKSDDSGTIVLIGNPRLYLTAHDKEGKLLFDGPIESSDERAKVPPELWDRVEPLVRQMRPDAEDGSKP